MVLMRAFHRALGMGRESQSRATVVVPASEAWQWPSIACRSSFGTKLSWPGVCLDQFFPAREGWGRQSKSGRPAACLRLPAPRTFFFLYLRSFCVGFEYERSETTSNGGPLGSCIDEERSELRYVV